MGKYGNAVDRVSSGGFFKFVDGANDIRFLTDPVAENKTFPDKPHDPQTIFSWYIWDYATKSVKILSKGAGFLRNLDAITEKWGEEMPMNCMVTITKKGSGLETKYTWVPSPLKKDDSLPKDWDADLKPLGEAIPGSIPINSFGDGDDPSEDFDLGGDDPFAGIPTVEK